MSTPCLHSASVADEGAVGVEDGLVEELGGLLGPDPQPRLVEGVHQGHDVGLGEAAAEVAGGGGVGDALGAQGVEVDLVVASQFEVFDPFAAGQDVEGDVQDVVGFVIGEMPLEEMEVVVDVADQAGPASQQEHGADAAGGEALDAVGEFVVDVGGGHHRLIAFGSGPILDAVEDSLADVRGAILRLRSRVFLRVAFSGLLGDSSSHSKASVDWNSEDVFSPLLFQNLRGFSSFFWDFGPDGQYITLG